MNQSKNQINLADAIRASANIAASLQNCDSAEERRSLKYLLKQACVGVPSLRSMVVDDLQSIVLRKLNAKIKMMSNEQLSSLESSTIDIVIGES